MIISCGSSNFKHHALKIQAKESVEQGLPNSNNCSSLRNGQLKMRDMEMWHNIAGLEIAEKPLLIAKQMML